MPSPSHNIARQVSEHAAGTPEREAIIDADRRLTYRALEDRVCRAAAAMRTRGVGPGGRIGLLLGNRSATLELVLAAARIGAIAMPINTRLAPPEIAQQLDDARPRLWFVEAELAETAARSGAASRQRLETVTVGGADDAYEALLRAADPAAGAAFAESGPNDPMILMYTSGTTGIPKGALLPHRKTRTNCENALDFFETRASDRVLTVVPLFHSFGLKILALPALSAGASVVLQPRFDPTAMWSAVETEGISYFGGVPTMFRALLEAFDAKPWKIDSLRFLFTAGSAIPVELIHAFEARGLRLQQGFGQTETSILCCLGSEDAVRKAGSVGRPVRHAEVRIARVPSLEREPEHWETCEVGETGEIVVRGELTMLGYWERPEATAETLRGEWLRTGDMATRDAEGFVTLTGRARDMIISGGENVYPRQVEAVYEEHPDVREIAVVGVPHERWGEVGCAFVVLEPGALLEPEALMAWGRERLAAFKLPRAFIEVAELPKTVTGKIQKFLLPSVGSDDLA